MNRDDSVSGAISPKFIRLGKSLLKDRRPIICDIGSRDALEGIDLMRKLNGRKLHVFEPNPGAAETCRANLEKYRNETGDAEIASFNPFAVTNHVGQVKFYPVNAGLSENKDIGFSSLLRINPDYTRRRGKVVQDEVTVNATTLDEYFAAKEHPDVLWVDVEGAELQVFTGAAGVLPGVKLVHVEVSFRPMQVGKPLFPEIHKYLTSAGLAFYGFMEISALRGFLYRRGLLPNPPWRLNAVFYRLRSGAA